MDEKRREKRELEREGKRGNRQSKRGEWQSADRYNVTKMGGEINRKGKRRKRARLKGN
jgi:hypothetical protein